MFDTTPTLISQYANSPRILALIDSFNSALDPINDINSFYNLIWNLDTATGYGLDVWGRILGQPRTINVPDPIGFFGFEQPGGGGASGAGFNQKIFWHGQYFNLTPNIRMQDDEYRFALYAKAAANISDASIPGINFVLRTLFHPPSPIWGGPTFNAQIASGILYMSDPNPPVLQPGMFITWAGIPWGLTVSVTGVVPNRVAQYYVSGGAVLYPPQQAMASYQPGIAYVVDTGNMTYSVMFGPPCHFNARVEVLGGVNTMTVASVVATPVGGIVPTILPGQVVAAADPANNAVWIPNTIVKQLTGATGGIGTYQMAGNWIVGNLDVISHVVVSPLMSGIINSGIIPKPCGTLVTYSN